MKVEAGEEKEQNLELNKSNNLTNYTNLCWKLINYNLNGSTWLIKSQNSRN